MSSSPPRSWPREALLLALLLLPIWAPLTRPGLPQTLAGPLPLWRGPTTWPDLFLRLAALAGLEGAVALKLSLGLAAAGLAVGLFGWAGQMAGPRAGVLAAALALYTPLSLSALYRGGDPTPLWAAAGLALAGWGLRLGRWPGWLLSALAAALFIGSGGGGAERLALAILLLQALLLSHWAAVASLAAGAAAAWLLLRPALPLPAPAGIPLHQLLEPGWAFDTLRLTWDTPPAYSLGLPLLALLLLGLWLAGGRDRFRGGPLTLFLLPTLAGLLLLPFAPLLALPFLALAAGAVLRQLPYLDRTPLFVALLILPLLAAGPGLSPAFAHYPTPWQPAATFGADQLLLVQAEVEGPLTPGAGVAVTAHWLAPQPPAFDYNIFLHAVDAAGNRVAQIDVQPQAGARPMTTWLPGEVIADRYELILPADAPPDLRLLLGVYNWQTLERLPAGAGDAVPLGP